MEGGAGAAGASEEEDEDVAIRSVMKAIAALSGRDGCSGVAELLAGSREGSIESLPAEAVKSALLALLRKQATYDHVQEQAALEGSALKQQVQSTLTLGVENITIDMNAEGASSFAASPRSAGPIKSPVQLTVLQVPLAGGSADLVKPRASPAAAAAAATADQAVGGGGGGSSEPLKLTKIGEAPVDESSESFRRLTIPLDELILERRVGDGGFSTTYKATWLGERGGGRTVAVKVAADVGDSLEQWRAEVCHTGIHQSPRASLACAGLR